MKRLTNMQKRVMELEDALMEILEVQITPSTPMVAEWLAAVSRGRKVVRNKVTPGWKKVDPLEHYKLEEQFKIDMEPEYIGAD